MIVVSDAFKTAVKASPRQWRPRLTITWTDALIDATIACSSNDDNYVHPTVANPDYQAADGISTSAQKWAHLDDEIKADGTWHPMPDDTESATVQMGWYGATRCNGSAVWEEPYIILTVEFSARAVLSLFVFGDTVYGEYPVDFDIKIYDGVDALLYTEVVTGNALLQWSKSIASEEINDAAKMELIIKKWSTADRVAKITEFYTGIEETYEGDDIVSMNLLEESEISDGSLPIGNISANELDFELQNINLIKNGVSLLDPFFYGNTNSRFLNLMKINRRVVAELGLILPDDSVEYVALGTFWTGDWKASEKSAVAATSARDRMELLRKAEFFQSLLYSSITLYDLLENVLNAAKTNIPMADLTWDIDAELEDFTVTQAYFPRQDYMKCIKQIVEACMGQAYMSRDDVLTVKGPSFAGIVTSYEITKDDYFDSTQPSKSEELFNFVRVPITAMTAEEETSEVYRSDAAVDIADGVSITIDAEYSDNPVYDPSGVLENASAGITITSEDYYACGAKVVVTNSGGAPGSFELVITGIKYTKNSDEAVEASDADSITEYGMLKYEYPVNHLLQSRAIGAQIAALLLASYKTWRKDITLKWRGDPSLELGDQFEAPEYQRHGIDERGTFRITKNKINFDGTLRAETDGRKVV